MRIILVITILLFCSFPAAFAQFWPNSPLSQNGLTFNAATPITWLMPLGNLIDYQALTFMRLVPSANVLRME